MAEKMATREAYGKTLVKLGKQYENLVVMDGDLSGSTKTVQFQKAYPQRFFNMGIAEQNLYGTAAGLAISGKVVCASTFAMFATGRAFEIIRNSIGYPHVNVKICATHAGITTGEDGASHQTFEDMALMRTIPGMTVVNPCDGVSTEKLLEQVIAMEGPVYVRLGRSAVPIHYQERDSLVLGKGKVLKEGGDVTIIATGIMVHEALKSRNALAEQGIAASVVDMHTIKPIDEDVIIEMAQKTGAVVTAEEHSVIGGLGSAVAEVLGKQFPCPLETVGQQDTYGESGKPEQLLEKYGMTDKDITQKVLSVMARK